MSLIKSKGIIVNLVYPRRIGITNHFLQRAKERKISENDIADAFINGKQLFTVNVRESFKKSTIYVKDSICLVSTNNGKTLITCYRATKGIDNLISDLGYKTNNFVFEI